MATQFQAAKDARLVETGRDSFAPVDESIFFNQGGSTRQPVWRRTDKGDLIRVMPDEEERGHLERKCVPPTGDYTLRLVGMAEPASEVNNFHDPNNERSQPFVLKAWMEFEILDGPMIGQWFSNKWTWPRALRKPRQGNIATMAEFAIRLLGEEPGDDFDRRDLIGIPFRSRVKNKSERYSALATDEVEPLGLSTPTAQSITLDQAGVIRKYSEDVWGTKLKGKQKLMVLLEAMYAGKDLNAFTYDEADQLINYFETDAEGIKAAVEQFENAEYSDVPELQK